jgi:hypothetical protein
MATKKELISKLKGRDVKLVGGKTVPATQFNFSDWKKSDVEEHLKNSRKRRR